MQYNDFGRTIERNYLQKWRFLIPEYEAVKAGRSEACALPPRSKIQPAPLVCERGFATPNQYSFERFSLHATMKAQTRRQQTNQLEHRAWLAAFSRPKISQKIAGSSRSSDSKIIFGETWWRREINFKKICSLALSQVLSHGRENPTPGQSSGSLGLARGVAFVGN
jgi:hypothetical protein